MVEWLFLRASQGDDDVAQLEGHSRDLRAARRLSGPLVSHSD